MFFIRSGKLNFVSVFFSFFFCSLITWISLFALCKLLLLLFDDFVAKIFSLLLRNPLEQNPDRLFASVNAVLYPDVFNCCLCGELDNVFIYPLVFILLFSVLIISFSNEDIFFLRPVLMQFAFVKYFFISFVFCSPFDSFRSTKSLVIVFNPFSFLPLIMFLMSILSIMLI